MARENRLNTLWPTGTKVRYCDAWGRNPIDGTVQKHYGESNILDEDARGVVHFGPTWRIETEPPAARRPVVDLDDLISMPAPLDGLLV